MTWTGVKKLLLATAVMALLTANKCTLGFSPRQSSLLSSPLVAPKKHVIGGSKLFATTLKTVNEKASSKDGDDDATRKKAMDALEKLLSRQQAEIDETKRLLAFYETIGPNSTAFFANGEEMNMESSDLMSIASSIMKGADYGFQSRSEGPKFDLKGGNSAFVGYGPPSNLWALGSQQFMRNLKAMQDEYEEEINIELTPKQIELQAKLQQLTLNSTAIWERELKDGPIEAPFLLKGPYFFLCWMLDVLFEGRYVPGRFFLLETVARMPYFSYIGMLHFYETLGFWRRSADMKRIHFAEELNEFRHLLIMESLGGDQRWWVRFMAQHSAVAYFIGLCALWCLSPTLSYKFSELLETHAVNTYSQFLDENEELLKELPPSLAAVDYYALGASDPYYAEFQTSAITKNQEVRRPGLRMLSLYDTFSAIRDDEGDHVGTMEACLDPTVAKLSPSLERKVLTGVATAAAVAFFLNAGGDAGFSTDGFVDTIDFAADETAASGLLDAAIAGFAGLASLVGGADPEDVNAIENLLEEGAFEELRNVIAEFAVFFTRFF